MGIRLKHITESSAGPPVLLSLVLLLISFACLKHSIRKWLIISVYTMLSGNILLCIKAAYPCIRILLKNKYLVFAERMISIHKKPINMGNLLSPKSISGKIDAWFFDSRRQLSCI